MDKYQEQVNSIRIATPCSADWDKMKGDDRKRFCQDCKLNVYNVSELSAKEASDLINGANGGRVCMQIYRRRDGTVITRDCPVAVQRVKRAYKRSVAAVASLAATIGLSLPASAQNTPAGATKGESVAYPLRGAVAPQELGDIDKSTQIEPKAVTAPGSVVEVQTTPRNDRSFGSGLFPDNMLAILTLTGMAIAAFVCFLKKRPAMWIIGITMFGMFATIGYLWSHM